MYLPQYNLERPIAAPYAFTWLARMAHTQCIGDLQLPTTPVIFAVPSSYARILTTVYRGELHARRPGTEDGLIPVADELPVESIVHALKIARAHHMPLVPVGLASISLLRLPGLSIPLPLTRMVICFEAPFQVPERPETIPHSWAEAISHLMTRAEGRAKDRLATWRQSASS